jgi:hypothetical protein
LRRVATLVLFLPTTFTSYTLQDLARLQLELAIAAWSEHTVHCYIFYSTKQVLSLNIVSNKMFLSEHTLKEGIQPTKVLIKIGNLVSKKGNIQPTPPPVPPSRIVIKKTALFWIGILMRPPTFLRVSLGGKETQSSYSMDTAVLFYQQTNKQTNRQGNKLLDCSV